MSTSAMIETHPHHGDLAPELLARTIDVLLECSSTCSQCADACLSEDALSPDLAACIRIDLDCADICGVTSRVVARQGSHDPALIRAQLEACATSCAACAAECDRHRGDMAHCRICAESCRRCEQACRDLAAALT